MVGMINRVSALEELISNGRDNQIISQINIKSQVSQVRRRKDRGGLGVHVKARHRRGFGGVGKTVVEVMGPEA